MKDQTLIQCGTEQDSINGQLQYSCWYELLPQLSRTIMPIFVLPGDHMGASIQLSSATTGEWNVTIFDLTSGQSFSNLFIYPSSMLSAEWIVERPEINHILSSLANFGTATFSDCSSTVGGVNGGIGDFPTIEVVMYASDIAGLQSLQLASVSDLSGLGVQFTVTYLASSG
jgi:hypothetical protein